MVLPTKSGVNQKSFKMEMKKKIGEREREREGEGERVLFILSNNIYFVIT